VLRVSQEWRGVKGCLGFFAPQEGVTKLLVRSL
jgi:hypothetical protein